jgi:hypothetical protein
MFSLISGLSRLGTAVPNGFIVRANVFPNLTARPPETGVRQRE